MVYPNDVERVTTAIEKVAKELEKLTKIESAAMENASAANEQAGESMEAMVSVCKELKENMAKWEQVIGNLNYRVEQLERTVAMQSIGFGGYDRVEAIGKVMEANVPNRNLTIFNKD